MKEFNRRVRVLVRIPEQDAQAAESMLEKQDWTWSHCKAHRATHSVDVLLYGAKIASLKAGVRLLVDALEGLTPVEVVEARLIDGRVPYRRTYQVKRAGVGRFERLANPLHWLIQTDADEDEVVARARAGVSPLAPDGLEKFSLHERIGPRPESDTLRRPRHYLRAGVAIILMLACMTIGYFVAEDRVPWALLGLLVIAYPMGLATSNNRQRRRLIHWALGLPFPVAAAAIGAGMSLMPQLEGGIWSGLVKGAIGLVVLSGLQHLWVAGVRHSVSGIVVVAGALGLGVKFLVDMMTIHVYTDWLGIPPGAALRTLASQAILVGPMLLATTATILFLAGCLGWYRYFSPDITKEFGSWIILLLVAIATPLNGFISGTEQIDKQTGAIHAGQDTPASVGLVTTPVCAKPTKPSIKVDGLELDFKRVLQHVATTDGRVWLWDVTNPVTGSGTARVGSVVPADVTLRRVTDQKQCD